MQQKKKKKKKDAWYALHFACTCIIESACTEEHYNFGEFGWKVCNCFVINFYVQDVEESITEIDVVMDVALGFSFRIAALFFF